MSRKKKLLFFKFLKIVSIYTLNLCVKMSLFLQWVHFYRVIFLKGAAWLLLRDFGIFIVNFNSVQQDLQGYFLMSFSFLLQNAPVSWFETVVAFIPEENPFLRILIVQAIQESFGDAELFGHKKELDIVCTTTSVVRVLLKGIIFLMQYYKRQTFQSFFPFHACFWSIPKTYTGDSTFFKE